MPPTRFTAQSRCRRRNLSGRAGRARTECLAPRSIPPLLGRLGLTIGDAIKIGEAVLQIRAVIEREPDAAASGLDLRAAGLDFSRGARRNPADPARRTGHLSTTAAAARGRGPGGVGKSRPRRVPRCRLADPQLWRSLASICSGCSIASGCF